MSHIEIKDLRKAKRKILVYLATEIVNEVRKKKLVDIGKLAVKYGYSRHYFMYEVIPIILSLASDVRKAKINGAWYLISSIEEEPGPMQTSNLEENAVA